jgi:hypothetical protein
MQKTSRGLPTTGYAIVVDGLMKTEFETKQGAQDGASELKKRFPMLQIEIYDATAKSREDVSPA